MRHEVVKTDITVIGGGLAGVCAAVAAARLGKSVALVQNRPVLGGNSSSEIRVWVCGATAHGVQRYARETGIMGEMFLENQYRNIDGNPYMWDLVVLETVRAEKNIRLFLNTDVHEIEAEGERDRRVIRSVMGWMMGSERKIRFESPLYLDCTGDGLIGFLAGAEYRIGRESRDEFNEPWAQAKADAVTLGSTILFYTKDAGHPVKYIPPSFAKDITQTPIPIKRVIKSGDSGCHYWWIEWGGELDTVHDNERIRDELWSVIYGIWDYIKNSGKFDADNLTLEWVGSIPGKREYRRFIGDYVLNQIDLIEQREFEDTIGFGGWSIDLHPPGGMYATESGSKHMFTNGVYHIPFRSLYSRNVENLMFAGRNISATHVAFGTTRVMATCAVVGEAAGTGAALAVSKGVTPREIARHHLTELQQTLLRADASLIGVRNADPQDLARIAVVSASGWRRRMEVDERDERVPMRHDLGIIVPVDPEIREFRLLVDAAEDTVMQTELWCPAKPQNYVPERWIASDEVSVGQGNGQWVTFRLPWRPEQPQNAFVIIKANASVHVYVSNRSHSGTLSLAKTGEARAAKELEDHDTSQLVVKWATKPFQYRSVCFAVEPDTEAFTPDKVTDGYLRPYGGPHMWISEPLGEETDAPWLQLEWEREQTIGEIRIIFNDDVNKDLINLHHHRTPWEIMPELVKDYRIEAWMDGKWEVLFRERDNRKRKRVHPLDRAIRTRKIRLVVESTNGSPSAEIIEVRVYP
jgi:hypothetical protein